MQQLNTHDQNKNNNNNLITGDLNSDSSDKSSSSPERSEDYENEYNQRSNCEFKYDS
jgi:hypothetical protein